MITSPRPVATILSTLILVGLFCTIGRSQSIDKALILSKARAAYYNLNGHKFNGLHAEADFNWEHTVKRGIGYSEPTVVEKYLPVHFDVFLDTALQPKVVMDNSPLHQGDSGFENIANNCKEIVEGSFSLLQPYLVGSLLDRNDSVYRVIDSAGEYWVSFIDNGASIRIRFAKTFKTLEKFYASSSMIAHSVLSFDLFEPEGLLPSHAEFTADVRTPGGNKHFQMSLGCTYAFVDGLLLPQRIQCEVEPNAAEWTYSNYELKKKL
jgi:hypothetical protein